MRNPFKRLSSNSRRTARGFGRDHPLALEETWRQEEERENRLREAFIVSALWCADQLLPLVKLVAATYLWFRQIWRFVTAQLLGQGVQSALQDPPKLDTAWQPDSELFLAGVPKRGSTAEDSETRATTAALVRWFGPAPEHEVVILHQGVIHLRGPGYRMEIRKSGRIESNQGIAWNLRDLTDEQVPNHVRLKAWRAVRLHDPVTGGSAGLWLLRGEPDSDGTIMSRALASLAIQQMRWLRVTGSVFGRLGKLDDMDKVDRDNLLKVLRGDPDISLHDMESTNAREILMRSKPPVPEQLRTWIKDTRARMPAIDQVVEDREL